MVTDVRPLVSRSRARAIRISRAGSTALVASSRTSRSGSARCARSQRDQLPLAGRQRLAALADPGVQAARQRRRASRRARARSTAARISVVGRRRACRRATLRAASRRTGSPPAAPSPPARRSEANGTSRRSTPSSRTRARGRVHQPGQQLGEGGLARPGLAHHRDPGARGSRSQVDVVQHRRAARVGERRPRRTRSSTGRCGSGVPASPGSTTSAGVSRIADHPAPAGDRVLRVGEHLGADLHRTDEQRHQEARRRAPCPR